MTFELDADGVRLWCSSPKWTRKLVERGARLVDPAQAAYLGAEEVQPSAGLVKKRPQPSSAARKAPRER